MKHIKMKIFLIIYGIVALLYFCFQWEYTKALFKKKVFGEISKSKYLSAMIGTMVFAAIFPITVVRVLIKRSAQRLADDTKDDFKSDRF